MRSVGARFNQARAIRHVLSYRRRGSSTGRHQRIESSLASWGSSGSSRASRRPSCCQTHPWLGNVDRGFFLVHVCSFNEWHEGHQFEPMKDDLMLSADQRASGYHNPREGSYRLRYLTELPRPVVRYQVVGVGVTVACGASPAASDPVDQGGENASLAERLGGEHASVVERDPDEKTAVDRNIDTPSTLKRRVAVVEIASRGERKIRSQLQIDVC